MLNAYVLGITPLLISLFFILGVFIFYEVLFDGVQLFLTHKEIDISSEQLRPWLGAVYIFILLISFQAMISDSATNWLFINFQITALVFCAILLNVPLKYNVFIPIILVFMLCNSALSSWESWCFALTIIGFYSSLKYIKDKRSEHYPFIYYSLDTIVFGFILWTLAKIKFSLDTVIVLQQLTYMIFFTIFAFSYMGLMLRNQRVKSSLYFLANHDELTSAKNHSLFVFDLNKYFNKHLQKQLPLTMMMFDIDNFKHVNDDFGHLAGDRVLQEVVKIVQNVINDTDKNIQLYRTGGEEFNLIFPNYSLPKTREIVQAIFQAVDQAHILYHGEPISITISVGVSELHTDDSSTQKFYSRVDSALYDSKHNGRNRITEK